MINFDTSAGDIPCTNPGYQPQREDKYPLLNDEHTGCDDYEFDYHHSEIIDNSSEYEIYEENM